MMRQPATWSFKAGLRPWLTNDAHKEDEEKAESYRGHIKMLRDIGLYLCLCVRCLALDTNPLCTLSPFI
jgi:hypothetical protein